MRVQAQVLLTVMVLSATPRAFADPAPVPARAKRAPVKPALPEVELGDDAKLAGVVSLYEAGKYADCADQLSRLLARDAPLRLRDREVVESARIYHAACLIGSGKPEAADEPLRAAIRSDMQMRPPDSLLFPPPVIDRFLRVRQSLYDEIKKAEEQRVDQARKSAEIQAAHERAERSRVAEIERLASQETLVIKNRRLVAWVPFGVGQFQNGNDGLGWVFLTGESALLATTLTSLSVLSALELEAARLKNPQNNAVLSTWNTLMRVSSYSFLGVAAVGIAQAQLAFVPEFREQRYRPLPSRLKEHASALRVVPNLAAGPGEFSLGLSGQF
jgi:hypothetical protein